ncbi:MAG: response regulator transcription factor [Actinomycetota bacterium]
MNIKAEVLIVEDEQHIADLVTMYLEQGGYRVHHCMNGEDALKRVAHHPPNLVILDIALPGLDGIEVCRQLRTTGQIPILMLTARDAEIDRVLGLEMGADDYLTKPFSPRELVARVKAILRRSETTLTREAGPLVNGTISVWPDRHEVTVDGLKVPLTAKEFDILVYLLTNRGMVVTRPQILAGVWGYDFYGGERTIDAHIRTIRKKLGEAFVLTTIRGVGYKVEHDD